MDNNLKTTLTKFRKKNDSRYGRIYDKSLPDTQYQVSGGTYPRFLKYGDKLYLFLDNRYRVSTDKGKTWSEETIIFTNETENTALGRNDIDDVGNAFPALLDDSGRIVIFYRCHSRASSYYSIVARVSDNTGANFRYRQELFHSASGYWEPFYYKGWIYYSTEHNGSGSDKAQSIYRRAIIRLKDDNTISMGSSTLFIDGRTQINMDGETNNLSRVGMISASTLKDGRHIFVFEDSVNSNATNPRPMVIQYCYARSPEVSPAGLGSINTIFMGSVNKSCGAPYVTTLDDGRIVISFQSNEFYTGYTPSIAYRDKHWLAYVSKKVVNYDDLLTKDDFIQLETYPFAENEYGCWGSVANIDGILYKTFSLSKNTSTTTATLYGNVIQTYFSYKTIPDCPSDTEGAYSLKCLFENGQKTYKWVKDNT